MTGDMTRTLFNRREHLATLLLAGLSLLAAVWVGYEFLRFLVPGFAKMANTIAGGVDLLLRHGEVQRWFSGDNLFELAGTYPPASYMMLWIVTGWLSLGASFWLWAGIYLCMAVLLGSLFTRHCGASAPHLQWHALLLPFATYGTGACIGNGQLPLLILPVLLATVLLAEKDDHWKTQVAAVILFTWCLVKPHFSAPFFWVLLARHPRTWIPFGILAVYLVLTVWACSYHEESTLQIMTNWATKGLGQDTHLANLSLYNLSQPFAAGISIATHTVSAWTSLACILLQGLWTWRHRKTDLWILLSVAALTARFWTYHHWYDDMLLLIPLLTLLRISLRRPEHWPAWIVKVAWPLHLLLYATLLAPGGLYLLRGVPRECYLNAQATIWAAALVYLILAARADKKGPAAG